MNESSLLVNCLWSRKWHRGKLLDVSLQKNVEMLGQGIYKLGEWMWECKGIVMR